MKIHGHTMDHDNQMKSAVTEGIRKAKTAWLATRNKIKKYTDDAKKIKIYLVRSTYW